MKKNIGKLDRRIRLIAGAGIIGLGILFKSWWGIIGFLPLLTAIIGWCPAYVLLKISTCKKEEISQ
ncbi:MAG: DUF2892 domain-containing protein [Candidatus Aureabacteria bacterium]|nr:DUF2892 domain-containing protein [Candidatus Auribacterota bacterium]